jgi:hypothetical protein
MPQMQRQIHVCDPASLKNASDLLRDDLFDRSSILFSANDQRLSFSVWRANPSTTVYERLIWPIVRRTSTAKQWLITVNDVIDFELKVMPGAYVGADHPIGAIRLRSSQVAVITYTGVELSLNIANLRMQISETDVFDTARIFRTIGWRICC